MATIERLTPQTLVYHLLRLGTLLEDCVEGGASIGFLWPMAPGEAERYWRSIIPAVESSERIVVIASQDARIVGTGALELCMKANGMHRAEVSKLMVMRDARHRGIGRDIMFALEDEARRHGRTTLVLDTFLDGGAEPLYRALGWTEAGRVPEYATWPDGTLGATVYYYKLLS